MQFRRADLADLAYFLEVAKHRSFRRAGAELGISASALSHALRSLEERLGVRLLNRTSRSVTLTAAGEELQTAILKPFDDIGNAVEVVNKFRDAPVGRIRLSVPTEAAELLVGIALRERGEDWTHEEFGGFCRDTQSNSTDRRISKLVDDLDGVANVIEGLQNRGLKFLPRCRERHTAARSVQQPNAQTFFQTSQRMT